LYSKNYFVGDKIFSDKFFLFLSIPLILFTIFLSLGYFGFFLLTPLFLIKTYKNWQAIWSRMKVPNFGKGFIVLHMLYWVIAGIMGALVAGTVVTGPLIPILLSVFLLIATLKMARWVALFSENAKVAYPVFIFFGSASLISVHKIFQWLLANIDTSDVF